MIIVQLWEIWNFRFCSALGFLKRYIVYNISFYNKVGPSRHVEHDIQLYSFSSESSLSSPRESHEDPVSRGWTLQKRFTNSDARRSQKVNSQYNREFHCLVTFPSASYVLWLHALKHDAWMIFHEIAYVDVSRCRGQGPPSSIWRLCRLRGHTRPPSQRKKPRETVATCFANPIQTTGSPLEKVFHCYMCYRKCDLARFTDAWTNHIYGYKIAPQKPDALRKVSQHNSNAQSCVRCKALSQDVSKPIPPRSTEKQTFCDRTSNARSKKMVSMTTVLCPIAQIRFFTLHSILCSLRLLKTLRELCCNIIFFVENERNINRLQPNPQSLSSSELPASTDTRKPRLGEKPDLFQRHAHTPGALCSCSFYLVYTLSRTSATPLILSSPFKRRGEEHLLEIKGIRARSLEIPLSR